MIRLFLCKYNIFVLNHIQLLPKGQVSELYPLACLPPVLPVAIHIYPLRGILFFPIESIFKQCKQSRIKCRIILGE